MKLPTIAFPDASSNEAALPQLEDLLTRILVLPLRVAIATGPEGSRLGEYVAIMQRRFPTQISLAKSIDDQLAESSLAILPGLSAAPSPYVEVLWRAGQPMQLHALLETRQKVESLRATAPSAQPRPRVQWFYHADVEALWDATWASIAALELVPEAAAAH